MTTRQKQLIENYIRLKVKKLMNEKKALKEEDWSNPYISVYRKSGNNSVEIGKYTDMKIANKVVKFLQSVANFEYMSERLKPTFMLKKDKLGFNFLNIYIDKLMILASNSQSK